MEGGEQEKLPPRRVPALVPPAGLAGPWERPDVLGLLRGGTFGVSLPGEQGRAGGVSSGCAPPLTDLASWLSFCLLLQSIVCTGRRQWHPDPVLVHCIQSCEVSHLPFPKPRPSSPVGLTRRDSSLSHSSYPPPASPFLCLLLNFLNSSPQSHNYRY